MCMTGIIDHIALQEFSKQVSLVEDTDANHRTG